MSTHNFKQLEYGKSKAKHGFRENLNPSVSNQERSTSTEETTQETKVLVNKVLKKVVLWEIKIIPIYLSLLVIASLLTSYFDCPFDLGYFVDKVYWLSTIILLYTLSYLFKFCAYHGMFLHYIVANQVVLVYDEVIGIPISDQASIIPYLVLIGIALFFILRSYLKHKSHESK